MRCLNRVTNLLREASILLHPDGKNQLAFFCYLYVCRLSIEKVCLCWKKGTTVRKCTGYE